MDPRIAIIVAISSDGLLYMACTQVNTNEEVFSVFMEKFIAKLKADQKFNDRPSCFVIDNASYHSTDLTKATFTRLGATMAFTSPYSWSTSACELFFAALKSRNLVPQNKPGGKK